MDIANLQIKVENSGVTKSVSELTKLEAQSVKTENANRRLAASYQRSQNSLKSAEIQTERLRLQEKRLEDQKKKLSGQTDKLSSSLGFLKTAFASFIAVVSFGQITALSDEFTEIQTKIKNVTSSTQEAAGVFNSLFSIAQRDGTSISTLADAYLKLNVSLTENVKKQVDIVKFTELLSRGLAASGANAQTASGVILQLTQGLATDFRAAGQELNSLIEGAPVLANIIAQELGQDSAVGLKALAESGNLTAEAFAKATIRAESAIKAFEIPDTISRSFVRLRNSFLAFVGESQIINSAASTISESIDYLAENFNQLEKAVTVIAVASFPAMVASIITGLKAISVAIYANPLFAISTLVAASVAALYVYRDEIDAVGGSFADIANAARQGFSFIADIIYGTFSGINKVISLAVNNALVNIFKLMDGIKNISPLAASYLGITEDSLNSYASKIDPGLIGKSFGEAFNQGFSDAIENGFYAKEFSLQNKITTGRKPVPLPTQNAAFPSNSLTKTTNAANATKELTKEQEQLIQKLDSSFKKVEKNKTALEEYAETARDTEAQVMNLANNGIKSLEDGFVNLVRGTESVSSAFKNMADSIIEDIIRMQVQRNITAPISSGINGLLGNIFGGGGGFGGVSQNIASSLQGIPGFNTGGSFRVGGAGGPDSQLVPLRLTPGEIVNVRKGGQSNGSSQPIINITNNVPEARPNAGVSPNGESIEIIIDRAVAKNINTPGTRSFNAIRKFNSAPLSRG